MAKSKPTPAAPPTPNAPADGGAYTVVARRYRPQQFAELIGQEHVAKALVNALQSGRVAHAYLFTGARGVGKTSAARILAKALNCERGPTAAPCDQCDSCRAVMTGDDMSVLEIDGASNNGVDAARDLRHDVKNRTNGRYRIYIIDEVHMLSTSAFNALLKTIEEPPEHVKFILATTEIQKIPITILSRCQRFDFAHVGPAKIFDQLKRIVEREGHPADDDALKLVARRAAGSMRDSQSLLDQLLGSSPGRLTAEQVSAVLGTAGDDRVIELAAAILANDPKAALDLISTWVDQGLQIGELVDQLVEHWRALMLVSCGGPDVRELPVSPNQSEAVKTQVKGISLDAILAGLEVLTATKARMRGSSHTQVLLEMAVVRLCRFRDLLALGQLVQAVTQPGVQLALPAAIASSAPAPRPAAAPSANGNDSAKKNGPLTARLTEESAPAAEVTTVSLTEKALPHVWSRFLGYAGEKFPILAKHLRSTSSYAIIGPNALVIRFPVGYGDAYDACAAESGVQRIQEAFRRVTGQAVAVKFEKERGATAPLASNGLHASAPPTDRKRSLASLPLFKKATETLGAQIWHVDDDFNPVAPPPKPARKTEEADDESGE